MGPDKARQSQPGFVGKRGLAMLPYWVEKYSEPACLSATGQ